MRPSNEVVAHIEWLTARMLERPHMYASSPAALEDVLTQLDEIRRYICDDESQYPASNDAGYCAYMQSQGYGAANFYSRHRPGVPLTLEDRELFNQLTEFWTRYRSSDYSTFD